MQKRPLLTTDDAYYPSAIAQRQNVDGRTLLTLTIPEEKKILEDIVNAVGSIMSVRKARGGDLFYLEESLAKRLCPSMRVLKRRKAGEGMAHGSS